MHGKHVDYSLIDFFFRRHGKSPTAEKANRTERNGLSWSILFVLSFWQSWTFIGFFFRRNVNYQTFFLSKFIFFLQILPIRSEHVHIFQKIPICFNGLVEVLFDNRTKSFCQEFEYFFPQISKVIILLYFFHKIIFLSSIISAGLHQFCRGVQVRQKGIPITYATEKKRISSQHRWQASIFLKLSFFHRF